MTTNTLRSPLLAINTLAGFNDVGSKLNAMLTAVGLTQTADTGQINWGTNTSFPSAQGQTIGYEIWRFNDALQATSPIFFKLAYGSAATSLSTLIMPTVSIQMGTGSNGAGTLTGAYYGPVAPWQNTWSQNSPVFTTTDNVASYAMYNATYGCAGLVYFPNCVTSYPSWPLPAVPVCFFQIGRTVDQTTGLPTGDGVLVHTLMYLGTSGSGPTNIQYPYVYLYSYLNGLSYIVGQPNQNTVMHMPASLSATMTGGVAQVYKQGYSGAKLGYMSQFCCVLPSEFYWGQEFDATPVGSTSLHYKTVGFRKDTSLEFMTASGQTAYSAMLWQ